jgi:uncharacterized protein YgiM (DUF1202 family)
VAITQLNVRAEPSTASEVLAIIGANTKVQIVGKDSNENWWQIVFEAGAEGKGWVTAQYVETAGRPEVPVIGGGANPQSGNTAIVIQQLNIRSGPGTSFNSLGTLNTNDIVSLTGKNSTGTWLQIDFPTGPDGKGWVNSGFVKADDSASLPIVSDAGDVIGTGTPANTPLPPTPTIVPAAMDFDSAEAPIKTVVFDQGWINSFIYNGDVSTPNGDTEDWVGFTSYDGLVFINIECTENNSVRAELSNADVVILCNQPPKAITVSANSETLVQILAVPSTGQLMYAKYSITIKENP